MKSVRRIGCGIGLFALLLVGCGTPWQTDTPTIIIAHTLTAVGVAATQPTAQQTPTTTLAVSTPTPMSAPTPVPPRTPAPTLTTNPTPVAPSPAPTFAGASTQQTCLATATVAQWADTLGVGQMIRELNAEWDKCEGCIGKENTTDKSWELRDLGDFDAAVLWTDTTHQKFEALSGKPIAETVFKINTQGSWGTYLVLAPIKVLTSGRSARLCDLVTDVYATFRKAEPATDP